MRDPNCTHPPMLLIVGRVLTVDQTKAIQLSIKDGDAALPIVASGELGGSVSVQVIECSWCRRTIQEIRLG